MAFTEKKKEQLEVPSEDYLTKVRSWYTPNLEIIGVLKEGYDLINEATTRKGEPQYLFQLKEGYRGSIVVATEPEFQEVVIKTSADVITLVPPTIKRWGIPAN